MPETLQEREESMRVVLRHIQAKRPFEEFTFEQQRILKECQDAGYFEGVTMVQMISGRIVAEYGFEPRLTYKGLQFLEAEPPTSTKPLPVKVSFSSEAMEEPLPVEMSVSESEHELQAEKECQERAERETEHKKDRRFNFAQAIVVALLTLFLTYLIEYLLKIF